MKEKIVRVFTAFSGYDSQCMSLERLGVEYELVGWSEIDKSAIKAHNAIYPEWSERNYGDISKIEWDRVPDFDIFTYSFPCQDISVSGLQRGFREGSGTRSSLLWECRRAIGEKRPEWLIMENVKNLVSKKNMPLFREWLRYLEGEGYKNYVKVIDGSEMGVPQHRERVFCVSTLSNEKYLGII